MYLGTKRPSAATGIPSAIIRSTGIDGLYWLNDRLVILELENLKIVNVPEKPTTGPATNSGQGREAGAGGIYVHLPGRAGFRMRTSVFVIALVALVAPVSAQEQDRPAPLFEEIGAPPGWSAAQPRPRPPVVRERPVRVDLGLIGGADGTLAPAPQLRLNLFPGTDEFLALLDRFEPTNSGHAWIGTIDGEPLSSVVLVNVNGTVVGSITTPGRTYGVRAADGVGTVSEIDERLLPRGGNDAIKAPPEPAPRDAGPDASAADGTTLIDFAVVYSKTALRAAGTEAALRASIDVAVARTNEAFSNSGIAIRLRHVETMPVDYEDSGDSGVDLDRVTDGEIPGVHRMRASTGADLVALIIGNSDPDICGIARVNDMASSGRYGYSITEEGCLLGLTFAHEIGHNLGAQHDWYVDQDAGAFSYSHGHSIPEYRMRTIMAYRDLCEDRGIRCPQIDWFSNPRIHIEGTDRAIGVPEGTDTTCPEGDIDHYRCDADNVRTLNAMARVVATFRHTNRLDANHVLVPRASIRAKVAACRLGYQGDGNLVAYADDRAYWASHTSRMSAGVAKMQEDGDLVVMDADDVVQWRSGTDGNPGAYVVVQDDCNVVIYAASGKGLWATGRP